MKNKLIRQNPNFLSSQTSQQLKPKAISFSTQQHLLFKQRGFQSWYSSRGHVKNVNRIKKKKKKIWIKSLSLWGPICSDSSLKSSTTTTLLPKDLHTMLQKKKSSRFLGWEAFFLFLPLATTADGSKRFQTMGALYDVEVFIQKVSKCCTLTQCWW